MNSMLAHTFNWVWVFSSFCSLKVKIPTIRDHCSTGVPLIPTPILNLFVLLSDYSFQGLGLKVSYSQCLIG